MLEKKATTSVPIHELLARRWSPRAFDPQKTVAREELAALLEAARWAPSCNGDEPWRYLIWDRGRDPEGAKPLVSQRQQQAVGQSSAAMFLMRNTA
jgi:hypothetical protein